MDKNASLFLGFDIGGSSVKWGYGNCQQGVLHHESLAITHRELSCLKSVFSRIIQNVDNSIGLKSIRAIGIGSPGTIDLQSGKIHGTNPNLPFWTDIKPSILIPSNSKIPVFCDNDANLMCLGEVSLWEGISDMVGITVGSGIGCGYVRGGKVFRGAHGYAMELGHVTIVPDGELCSCQRRGCLEAYASVDGIKRRAATLGEYPNAMGWNLLDLLRHAGADARLQDMISEGERLLARALTDLTILLDPQLIALGGGGMEGRLYSVDNISALILAQLPIVNRPFLQVHCAKAGNKAGVLGAIALAETELSAI